MSKSKRIILTKYITVLLFSICVFQNPISARADYVVTGNSGRQFTVGEKLPDGIPTPPNWSGNALFLHDKSYGYYYCFSCTSLASSISLYRDSDDFVMINARMQIYKYESGAWKLFTTGYAKALSTGMEYKYTNMYVVPRGSYKVYVDGICILNSPNPTPSPTPTPTATPTPIPAVEIDANEAGVSEIFDFAMRILNIPFNINGYEVTCLQIFIYIALASGVLYLIFGGTRD